MNEINLGPRLHTVASYVSRGARIADIGTDHAYLPIYLYQKGLIEKAIGIDVHQGPYKSALGTVKSYGLSDQILIRFGDGLHPLKENEVDTLILAGMGGITMIEILSARPEILHHVNQVIAQPQGASGKLRLHMMSKGWLLNDEQIVFDEGKIYTIINFSQYEGLDLRAVQEYKDEISDELLDELSKELVTEYPVEQDIIKQFVDKYFWEYGPILLHRKDTLVGPYAKESIEGLEHKAEQMKKSKRAEISEERQLIKVEINVLEVLQKWLSRLD